MTNETMEIRRWGRLDADAKPVAWTLAGLLTLTATAAMALSFQAHMQVAAERLGAGRLAAAYPVAVDGALVGLAVAMLVQARRGESRILSGLFLSFFTLLSSTVNVVHVLDLPGPASLPYTGAVLGALLPVMVLGLTEVLCRVIFSVPRDESADLAQEVEEPDQPSEHAPAPEVEPAAESPMPRSVTRKMPEPRSAARSPRRSDHSSAVPADRIVEVNEAIDRLLKDGLSRQSIADRLTDELQIPISKSRVSRRANVFKEVAA
ncbi:DUF2637 domain-containing protein [Brevibacterium linens]|uniref:DUF2637 domain-containing protein n=1 Tax=Brevibacterium linens TaxID=1703 RepID=UPI000C764E1B